MPGRQRTRAWWARRGVALVALVGIVAIGAADGRPPPPPPAAADPDQERSDRPGAGVDATSPARRTPAAAAASGSDVVAFGRAGDHGATHGAELTAPVVAMAATPTGDGHWEVASDGAISSFGDATHHGSTADLPLQRPIVAMAPTPSGDGYWLTASDGGIFSFGDATHHGSTADLPLQRPIVAMAPTPSGDGYWLTASDGGIFSFGDATYAGSLAGIDLAGRSAVAVVADPEGDGYWLALGRRPLELPRGGRTLFPDWRVVAHYGGPQSARLGILGNGTPQEATERVAEQAGAYERFGRPVLPAFELIATIATSAPGRGGAYSAPLAEAEIQRYLDAARAEGMLLVLDIQPGRAPFLDEVKRHERFLRQPDVGLALDPEWSLRAPAVPGGSIGSTDAATINEVGAWLSGIVAEEALPEKLFVVHQFTGAMVRDRHLVVDQPGLATTFHVDGFGGRGAKLSKYQQLRPEPPFAAGFKLFYTQDTDLLAPDDVMSALSPPPDLVTYQ